MKVLWLCNKAPTLINQLRGKESDYFGGWLDDMLQQLSNKKDYEVGVLIPEENQQEGKVENISFWTYQEYNCYDRFCQVIDSFQPSVIHIWGTEMWHTLEMVKSCEDKGCVKSCVISIQGLVSLYGQYHFIEGLPHHVVIRRTLRDLLKHTSINVKRKEFIKSGTRESEALKHVDHVIGRTVWDRAAVLQFSPSATYHFCNESLREPFYHTEWELSKINRHSIFVSQCGYPIKGFHYLLEAMPEILKVYPDTHIYTTGQDLNHLTTKQKVMIPSYQKYLISLMKKYGLQDKISFLGMLSAEEMCRCYQNAHVFISPSTIENSPNSVGEAMLVGCPIVASDVGGTKSMLVDGKEGYLYQSSAPYMLAYYVKRIFEDDALATSLAQNARVHAMSTHDRNINFNTLLQIYDEVMKQSLT